MGSGYIYPLHNWPLIVSLAACDQDCTIIYYFFPSCSQNNFSFLCYVSTQQRFSFNFIFIDKCLDKLKKKKLGCDSGGCGGCWGGGGGIDSLACHQAEIVD